MATENPTPRPRGKVIVPAAPSTRAMVSSEKDMFKVQGAFAVIIWIAVVVASLAFFWDVLSPVNPIYPSHSISLKSIFGGIVGAFCAFYAMGGFTIVQPNTAVVGTFFGTYAGTLREDGFYWINPLLKVQRLSLKAQNHMTPALKVNDGNGNPIEIAAAIVWRIENPAAALFDVEDVGAFVDAQSESALRALASSHPYDGPEEGKPSLRRHADEVIVELINVLQARIGRAGVCIDEARFTHMAYAPEIAQSMLRKQQAQSIVAARETIVEGAVSMVEKAVNELETRKVVKLNDSERARLVTNMLTVLLSEEGARPVISVSTAAE